MLEKLEPVYPGTTQVRFVDLDQADDLAVWQFTRENNFTIVTRDSDFHEFSLIYGSPPKVIWLKSGNTSRQDMLCLMLNNQEKIIDFFQDEESGCLEIY